MVTKLLIAFAIIFLYKLISSIIDFANIKRYQKMYLRYLNNADTSKIFENKSFVIELFKKAGIKDSFIPVSQPVGYGQVANINASVFTMFPSNRNIFIPTIMRNFSEAIGVYKRRMMECFSLLYWIKCVIFLPQKILIYLNVSANSIFIKMAQLIYWLLGIILTLFSDDIANYLKSFIHF